MTAVTESQELAAVARASVRGHADAVWELHWSPTWAPRLAARRRLNKRVRRPTPATSLTPGSRLLVASLVLAAVACLFFLPLAWGETHSDVANRQNEVFPWASVQRPSPPAVHYDQPDVYYPWQVFLNRALRSGELPLWNPYSFAGQPFLANGQNGALYPPRTLLSLTVQPERVHDFLVTSHMFLGGLTMYALLTAVPLTSAAALFGAMAWMLNSFMLGWMALEHFVVIEAWLPLAVLLVQKALQHRSWPISIALGAVLALVFLGGHPLYVQISLAAWGGYAAYLLLSRWRGRLQNAPTLLRIRSSMTDGAIVIVAVLILAGLVAVQALPNLALVLSQGRSPLSYDQLMTFRMSASQLVYFFLPPPLAFGGRYDPYYETILQDSVLEVQRGMLFLGTPTALLAVLGLVQRHPLARYAAGLAVVSLGVALGTPIAWAAYHLLPGFSYFKPLSRDLFLFNFSAAILAAFGADFVLRRVSCPPNWPRLPLLALGLRPGIAVLATLVVILQMHHLGTRVIRFQPSDPDHLFPETPLIRALEHDPASRLIPLIPG